MNNHLTLKEAAEALGRSEDTVRRHVVRLKEKNPSLIGTKIIEEAISSGHWRYRVDVDFLREKINNLMLNGTALHVPTQNLPTQPDAPTQAKDQVPAQENGSPTQPPTQQDEVAQAKDNMPTQNNKSAQANNTVPTQSDESAQTEVEHKDDLHRQAPTQDEDAAYATDDLPTQPPTQDEESAQANQKTKGKNRKKREAAKKQEDATSAIIKNTIDILTKQLGKKDEQLEEKDKQINKKDEQLERQGGHINGLIKSKEHSDLIIAGLGARLGLIEPGKSAEEVIKKVEAEEIVEAEIKGQPTEKHTEENKDKKATKKVKSQAEDVDGDGEDRDLDEEEPKIAKKSFWQRFKRNSV